MDRMELNHSILVFDRNEHSSFFEGNYLEDFKALLLACWLSAGSQWAGPELDEQAYVDERSVVCASHGHHVAVGLLGR